MLDPLRHYSYFQPDRFGDQRVDVIGVGATGSRVVMELAKHGVQNLHIWDFDTVEPHNLANQLYAPRHVGMPKVAALANVVEEATGTVVTVHPCAASERDTFGEVVFLLVDSMKVRKELFKSAIASRIHTRRMIETRLGADQGRVYSIDPRVPCQVRGFERTLYSDSQAERPACGTSVTIGASAEIIAGLAVFQFLRWFRFEMGTAVGTLENEILIGFDPTTIVSNRFL